MSEADLKGHIVESGKDKSAKNDSDEDDEKAQEAKESAPVNANWIHGQGIIKRGMRFN